MPRKFWTPERDEELRRLMFEYPNLSAAETDRTIGAILGCTMSAVAQRRHLLHLWVDSSAHHGPACERIRIESKVVWGGKTPRERKPLPNNR